MTKPIPKVYATRFFQLVTMRQFAEAERILERVKQKMHISERNRGYFQALYGMLLTQKSNNDRYAFLSGIDPTDKKQLKNYRQEFLSHAQNRLHAEYDRGFFEAWSDYMRVLPKLKLSRSSSGNKSVAPTNREKETETRIEAKVGKETTEQTTSEDKERPKLENTVKIREEKEPTKEKSEPKLIEPRQRTLFDFAK